MTLQQIVKIFKFTDFTNGDSGFDLRLNSSEFGYLEIYFDEKFKVSYCKDETQKELIENILNS